MELRKKYKYALVVPTSIGVRITPLYHQPVYSSNTYFMHATSAETNVASISSYLGLPVKVLTKFVKDSPISAFIKRDLASRNMDYEGIDVPQGSPWGYRHQFNIADSGYGVRGPRVYNDRAGEVGLTLKTDDFNLRKLFNEEGVQIMHLSGLIASLSSDTGKFCLELVRYAKKSGTRISFDLNHRASFWKGREKKLREVFIKIAGLADILIGNEEDYQLCLGINGPEIGGRDINRKIDSFKEMINRVKEIFPNVFYFANTLREVVNANMHLWGAILHERDNWYIAEPREIQVLDRIGGGDGFVGGLLYGILKGWAAEKCLQFAWAAGAMATTFLTDYVQPINEEQIWSIWEGNARVIR